MVGVYGGWIVPMQGLPGEGEQVRDQRRPHSKRIERTCIEGYMTTAYVRITNKI